jgi:predicted dehydrogenase
MTAPRRPSASEPVRVAVVGAGIMGANHVRIAHQLPGLELVAVVDADLERAQKAAGVSGTQAFSTMEALPDLADLVVLAVPTKFHADAALELIAAGVHLLVEKPLALTSVEGQRIVDAANLAGITLAVGHVERFNAAVVELPKFLDNPIHIDAVRVSPFSARISDGVIFDLMIHDLDIALSLAGEDAEVTSVSGVARHRHGGTEDLASVNVTFSNGLTASLLTSRLGQQKQRTITVTQNDSVVLADLVRQDLTIQRMTRHEYLAEDGARYRTSSTVEVPFLETRGEPLANELAHVADCVRTGARPRVDGNAALRALKFAEAVTAAVRRS